MKISTPICDFVKKYKKQNSIRAHVPGHKGKKLLGCEPFDITEINGADELYSPNGIICQSESNATTLFDCPTFYSTEGSSLAIRSMLYLVKQHALTNGKKPKFLATRNVHKSFLTGVGLLDIEVEWIYNKNSINFITCDLTSKYLNNYLENCKKKPTALYLTSPDYLGNILDIEKLAEVCHKFGVLLVVDNAHGSYLKFLNKSEFPIDLGADMCCSSAHKTLPVLTGGAYLHLSKFLPKEIVYSAKSALSLFASTSPSYLILQSLDYANKVLDERFKMDLDNFVNKVEKTKLSLIKYGYHLIGNDKLKIVIDAKKIGYLASQLAQLLVDKKVYIEFADSDYLVLMLSPFNNLKELAKINKVLLSIPLKNEITQEVLSPTKKIGKLSLAEVLNCTSEQVHLSDCLGRIYADFNLPCPPAVPMIMPGELIDENAIKLFTYYDITKVKVVK